MEKVTVVITTYNLEDYIGKAIDSVAQQKTTFEYKIVVADDASTDKTVEKIKEKQTQYPDKIVLLESEVNLGSLKNSNRVFADIKSEYLSFLDGDDYWIGTDRLQKQIDYLEKNKEYSICGGQTICLENDEITRKVVSDKLVGKSFSFSEYENDDFPFVHTSSIVLRNTIYKNGLPQEYRDVEDTFENCAIRGESYRFFQHLRTGKMFIMEDTLSCYRIHAKGMWQGASPIIHDLELAIYCNFMRKKYSNMKIFETRFIGAYRRLLQRLLTEKSMHYEYTLSEKETFLFTHLLMDISKHNVIWEEVREKEIKNNLKDKFEKIINRIFK